MAVGVTTEIEIALPRREVADFAMDPANDAGPMLSAAVKRGIQRDLRALKDVLEQA